MAILLILPGRQGKFLIFRNFFERGTAATQSVLPAPGRSTTVDVPDFACETRGRRRLWTIARSSDVTKRPTKGREARSSLGP